MRRFFFFIFRRISSKFYFCQIFYEKNFYEKFFSLHHAKLLPYYHAKLLPHYHTKSLKSNFLTPKSYSAPATVKFYTVSNFINKLQLISCKQAGCQILRISCAAPLFENLFFLLVKFENFLILRYNIYRKSRKTKKK